MFEYVEIFHNRQRRHSSIGMLTPIEYENIHHTQRHDRLKYPDVAKPGHISSAAVVMSGRWAFVR